MLQQFAAIGIPVHSRLICKLVNKTLDKEAVLGVINRAPGPKPDMVLGIGVLDQLFLDFVWNVRRFGRIMLLNKHVFPRHWHAVIIKTGFEATDRSRAIPVLLSVLLS